jgi:hypothetical protein
MLFGLASRGMPGRRRTVAEDPEQSILENAEGMRPAPGDSAATNRIRRGRVGVRLRRKIETSISLPKNPALGDLRSPRNYLAACCYRVGCGITDNPSQGLSLAWLIILDKPELVLELDAKTRRI